MQVIFFILLVFTMQQQIVFDFSKQASMRNWMVVDDGVMGGLSAGRFTINEAGHGLFTGTVSLDNNGGFSSLRYMLNPMEASSHSKFTIRLKGDGKNYQFRVKSKASQYYSYVYTFSTTGQWQTVDIPFSDLSPSFRGQTLNLPAYPGTQLAEIGFLIGNKKAESFQLEIDLIAME